MATRRKGATATEKRSALPVVALLVSLVALAGVVWTRLDPPQALDLNWARMTLDEREEMVSGTLVFWQESRAMAVQALKELGPHLDDWAKDFLRATIDHESTRGLIMRGRKDGIGFRVRVPVLPIKATLAAVFVVWGIINTSDATAEEKARAFERMVARFFSTWGEKLGPEDE